MVQIVRDDGKFGFPSEKDGWCRVGVWDSAKRRSAWVRLVVDEDAVGEEEREQNVYVASRETVKAVQWVWGREGDDGFWEVSRESPEFDSALDLATSLMWFSES